MTTKQAIWCDQQQPQQQQIQSILMMGYTIHPSIFIQWLAPTSDWGVKELLADILRTIHVTRAQAVFANYYHPAVLEVSHYSACKAVRDGYRPSDAVPLLMASIVATQFVPVGAIDQTMYDLYAYSIEEAEKTRLMGYTLDPDSHYVVP